MVELLRRIARERYAKEFLDFVWKEVEPRG
jgi:hypothetical protein